jgi:hypothetical protein
MSIEKFTRRARVCVWRVMDGMVRQNNTADVREEGTSEEDVLAAGMGDRNRDTIEDAEDATVPDGVDMPDAIAPPATAAVASSAEVQLTYAKLSNCYLGNHAEYATAQHAGEYLRAVYKKLYDGHPDDQDGNAIALPPWLAEEATMTDADATRSADNSEATRSASSSSSLSSTSAVASLPSTSSSPCSSSSSSATSTAASATRLAARRPPALADADADEDDYKDSGQHGMTDTDAHVPVPPWMTDANARPDSPPATAAPATGMLLPGRVEVERTTSEPLSEFDNNHIIFGNAFPWLYPLGAPKHIVKARMPLWYRRLALFQGSLMCAHEPWFYFLLINQMQRFAGLLGAKTVNAHPKALSQLADLMDDKEFMQKLNYAKTHPKSEEAKQYMKILQPIVRATSKQVPFSSGSQAAAISTMVAMCHTFSLPNVFFTFAMDDTKNTIVLRLSSPCRNGDAAAFPTTEAGLLHALREGHESLKVDGEVTIDLSKSGLNSILSKNPVAAAQVFQALMDNVYRVLLGVDPASVKDHQESKTNVPLGARPKGIFGHTKAVFSVVEVQARLTLHSHMAVWTTFSAELMQKCASTQVLRDACQEVLDSYVSAEIRPIDMCAYLLRLVVTGAMDEFEAKSAQFSDCPQAHCPDTCSNDPLPGDARGEGPRECAQHNRASCAEALQHRFNLIMAQKNMHQHGFTCKKGLCGQAGCRLCYPRAVVDTTTCVQLHILPPLPPEVAAPAPASGAEGEPARAHGTTDAEFAAIVDAAQEGSPPLAGMADAASSVMGDGAASAAGTSDAAFAAIVEAHLSERGPDGKRKRTGKKPQVLPRVEAGPVAPFAAAIGDRPTYFPADGHAQLPAGMQRAHHVFGPKDERLIVWETRRPRLQAEELLRDIGLLDVAQYPHLAGMHRTDAATKEKTPVTFADVMHQLQTDPAKAKQYEQIQDILGEMNGAVVDASPTGTVLLSANTAAYTLGCSVTAKNVLFYLVKYLVKDGTEIGSTLAFLVHAKTMADRYQSKAADRAEDIRKRETLHVVQILLNRLIGAYELSDTQAVSCLIGVPQFQSTITTKYLFATDAVLNVTRLRFPNAADKLNAELPPIDDDNGDASSDDDDEEEGEDDDDDDALAGARRTLRHHTKFVKGLDGFNHGNRMTFGSAPTYTVMGADQKPIMVVYTQYQSTRDRAKEFGDFSLWEMASMVETIEKLKPKMTKTTKDADAVEDDAMAGADANVDEAAGKNAKDEQMADDAGVDAPDTVDAADCDAEAELPQAGRKGRKPNLRGEFSNNSPLAGQHCQMLLAKYAVPIWAGNTAPRAPPFLPPDQAPSEDWLKHANHYAVQILTVFCPLVTQFDVASGAYDRIHLGIPRALAQFDDDERTEWECLIGT